MNYLNYLAHHIDSWVLLLVAGVVIVLVIHALKTGKFATRGQLGVRRDKDPIGFWVLVRMNLIFVLVVLAVFVSIHS